MKKVTLITGASSGIGLELAKTFAKHHHNLLLLGRNTEVLNKLKKQLHEKFSVNVWIHPGDLLDDGYFSTLMTYIQSEKLLVNQLVNNAGCGLCGGFNLLPIVDQINMIKLNVIRLTELTHLLVPKMIENNTGKILQVSSLAAFIPGPNMAIYYATKAFVNSFSKAIYYELKHTNITVTQLCPGPVETQFGKRANFNQSNKIDFLTLKPDFVAEKAYVDFVKGKSLSIPGLVHKAMYFLNMLAPEGLRLWLVSMTHKRILK